MASATFFTLSSSNGSSSAGYDEPKVSEPTQLAEASAQALIAIRGASMPPTPDDADFWAGGEMKAANASAGNAKRHAWCMLEVFPNNTAVVLFR